MMVRPVGGRREGQSRAPRRSVKSNHPPLYATTRLACQAPFRGPAGPGSSPPGGEPRI